MSAEAHNESLEDFVYIDGAILSRNKETLISYEGNAINIEIPEGIKIISEKAFAGNAHIQSIIIPESVKIIENEAFELCVALKQVIFKGTDVAIGEGCFAFCEVLNDIVLPKCVKSIGRSAFTHSAIESITIPKSLMVLDGSVFNSCKRLKQVVFEGTSIEIGDGCFIGCETLEDISLPKSTKSIGESAFEYCESLKQIYIPSSVECISKNVFSYCKKLKDVVISEGVKEIHYGAFQNCDALEEIYIPYSMEYVGCHSFSKLKQCYYDNPKTFFEEDAFEWCDTDFRLFLPKGANIENAGLAMPMGIVGYTNTSEGLLPRLEHLFSNMVPYMADVPIDIILKGPVLSSIWRSLDSHDRKGGVYTNGMQSFLCLDHDYFRYKNQEQKQYKVLDGTKYICDYAFHLNNNSLLGREYDSNHCPFVTIELPSSLIAIGDFSFARCNKLAAITLPEKLSYIGKNPFVATWNLNAIISKSPNFIVDSDCLISIESGTIIHCFHHAATNEEHSDSLTIPSYVNKLGDYSFADSVAYVRELTIPETVIHVGKGAFKKNNKLKEIIFEGKSVVIEDETFSWCRALKRITLPKDIKRIGNRLFEYCKSLIEINIPDGVTEIGDSVFDNCISLKTIEIPYTVEKIGVNPFINSGVENLINHSNCFEYDNGILYTKNKRMIIACISKSEKIAIPICVEEIGQNAFSMSEHLEEITVPSSVKTIHQGAFSGCKALKKVSIENGGINTIEKNTFSGCTSLTEFSIPDGVTEIEDFAFSGCNSLKTLYSPSTIKHVSFYAFDSHPCPVETTWLPWGIEKNGLPGQKKTMSLEDCNLWMDDFGVVYSKDKKSVIKATKPLDKYSVLEGSTTIKQNAFSFTPWQRSLNEIHLPNSIKRIEQGAFAFCEFSEVSLPESLEYIGQGIFIDCTNLKQVTIPSHLSMMEGNPFLNKNYELINNSSYFTIQNKILFSSSQSKIISCLDTKSIKLKIGGANTIGPYSFACCKAKEIVIEPSVKVIEERAFNNACIERIILPNSLVEIKQYAFEMCLNLSEITIPSSTRIIGDCAFWGCLNRVIINSRDIKIGRDAFHSDKLSKIIVPRGCLDYYRSILPNYSSIIEEQ